MEFLVEFEVEVPEGTPESEVERRSRAESIAAARLADKGHLLRIWRRAVAAGDATVIGLYQADSSAELDDLLRALPLADWLLVRIIPLAPHPNDPHPVGP
jgi:muconolactone D-isomerase